MAIWSNGSLIRPTEMGYSKSYNPTIIMGHHQISAVEHFGNGTLNASVGAVTDITDPAGTGGWTNLVNITGGPLIVSIVGANPYGMRMSDADTDSNALRMQMLVDGKAVLDSYGYGESESTAGIVAWEPIQVDVTEGASCPIYCPSTFTIRAARVGDMVSGETYIKHGEIRYEYVEPA